jgi:tetratricopeptide (TPR) repeat protein
MQNEIGRAVASALKIVLTEGGAKSLAPVATKNPLAYEAFLNGLAIRQGAGRGDSLDYYKKAVELDPGFARAHAALAARYAMESQDQLDGKETYWRLAESHARKGLDLDPDQSEAYAALGLVSFFERRYLDMERAFLKGLAINPNDAELMYLYSFALTSLGRATDCSALMERLLAIDPLRVQPHVYAMGGYLKTGDFDKARAHAAATANSADSIKWLAQALIRLYEGDFEEAAELFGRFWAGYGLAYGVSAADFATIYLAGMTGEPDDVAAARPVVDKFAALMGEQHGLAPAFYFLIDDREKALAMFKSAFDPADEVFLSLIWEPFVESIAFRRSNEFKAFARGLGLEEYWRTYGWPNACKPTGPDDFTCV